MRTFVFTTFLVALLAAFGIISPERAYARSPLYGGELEFTSEALQAETQSNGISALALEFHSNFVKSLGGLCKEGRCKIEKIPPTKGATFSPYKVTYPDGWWYVVNLDDRCVEVQTKPATLAELKKQRSRMNRDLFKTATTLGLHPDNEFGAGHFNIGDQSAFGNSTEEFFRFFTDYENHPELTTGVLGHDPDNAPTLAQRTPKERAAMSQIVSDFNTGKINNKKDLAARIENEVYLISPTASTDETFNFPEHFTGVGLSSMVHGPLTQAHLELRGIRGQRNMDDFILLAELFEGRMKFLSETKDPIIYRDKEMKEFHAQDLVSRYYKYVVEAGLSWKKFSNLLPSNLTGIQPDSFMTGKESWDSEHFRTAMSSYMPEVATSSWMREKLFRAFMAPGAVRYSQSEKMLDSLVDSAWAMGDSVEAHTSAEFARRVLSTKSWREGLSPGSPVLGKLAGLEKKLAWLKSKSGSRCFVNEVRRRANE